MGFDDVVLRILMVCGVVIAVCIATVFVVTAYRVVWRPDAE